jgi:SAM-dependent methyltransferase
MVTVPTSPRESRRISEVAREQSFDKGYRQVARLAAEIEAHTGCTLESRRALDFGCGVGRVALPLAERCEHVYGLDISPLSLRQAELNAKRMNRDNVEWMDARRLPELAGKYDLVESLLVFQHIPSREGQRIFAQLVGGLAPGGVGAIEVALRPQRPLTGLLRSFSKSLAPGKGLARMLREWNWSYAYMLMHSYSLNGLGALLEQAGVTDWHARWHHNDGSHQAVTIVFRKSETRAGLSD